MGNINDNFDKFYENVNKIFHFDDCLVEAIHETIENNLKKGRKMIVKDGVVISLDMEGNPHLDNKGKIIKTKFPQKQLDIINAYWAKKE